MESFLRHGHGYELYVYRPTSVDRRITLKDANEIIPEAEIFYFFNEFAGRSEIVPFSDLFRLKLLHDTGGWWCDVDTLCLSNAMPECPYAWGRGFPLLEPANVYNGILAFPRQDPIIGELYRRASALGSQIGGREALGSDLISRTFADLGLPLDRTGDAASFYPISWIEFFKLWMPEFTNEILGKMENALFLPLYASVAKDLEIDMSILPPYASFFDLILGKYGSAEGGEGRIRRRYSEAEIGRLAKNYIRKFKLEESMNAVDQRVLALLEI